MNNRQLLLSAILLWGMAFGASAQPAGYELDLEEMSITNLGGIQSYAFGQHNGKWLIIGGRLDGLHRRQPFAAFDIAGHNTQLIVVDPVAQQHWTAPMTSLSTNLQEQLSATNPNFLQEGTQLYIIGGYGYSATAADHITYDKLAAVDVAGVITAIVNGQTQLAPYFRQITDPQFAVTGGRLEKIYDTYYLVGGQKFTGRYNPMNGPSFVQEYTNQIRRFTLQDDGTTLTVQHLTPHTDPAHLHRRDYNVAPQIMPNGQEGLTAFSGVFQVGVDLPFLDAVNIDSSGYAVDSNFTQYYNHYHCATLPMYSAQNNVMQTFFFGGIAQFYDDNGTLVQDDNVPFVKTIAKVQRDASGQMSEVKLPIEMPTYLGAGSEFIPNLDLPHYHNGIFKSDELTGDSILLGYIYGGISSTAPNIFFTNDGTQSLATSQIYKVILRSTTRVRDIDPTVHNFVVYPNPSDGRFFVRFDLEQAKEVRIRIQDATGRLVDTMRLSDTNAGINGYALTGLGQSGTYVITLETDKGRISRKAIVR